MSKFCQNCGKALDDAVRFCDGCGAPQQAEAPQAAPAAPKQDSDLKKTLNKAVTEVKTFANGFVNRCKADKKFLYTCLGVVAGVIVVIVLLSFLLGGGYKSAIDNYIAASFKGKSSAVKKMAPAEYWDYYEEKYDTDFDEYLEDYEDNIEDTIDYLKDEYGDNFKVTYKIEKEKKLSDKKLEGIAEALADKYDIDEDKVTAGYELDVEMTIKGSEDDDENETELTVIKYKGSWYLISWSKSGDNYYAYFYVD